MASLMPSTDDKDFAVGEHAIRRLIHRTRPGVGRVVEPSDAAEIIATLAAMTGMLPQLLGQLACSLEDEHHRGRLRVDDLAPLPDIARTVHALTNSLRDAIECTQHAAAELDNAHQHAAHLAPQPGPEFVQINGAKSLDETQPVPPTVTGPALAERPLPSVAAYDELLTRRTTSAPTTPATSATSGGEAVS
jgi:hypothetical protein